MATIPMASWALMRPGPSTVTIAMARRSAGNARSTSIRRISRLSALEPKKPAIDPMIVPRMIAKPTVRKPICRLTRLPKTTRLNTSRAFPSRPMRCSGWVIGQPSRWMQGARRGRAGSSMPRSGWVGSNGAMTPAKIAMRTRKARAVRPTIAERCRRMFRSVSRSRLTGFWFASGSAISTANGSACRVIGRPSCEPDPRVQERVRDVDDQVHHDVDDRDDDDHALDDDVVATLDRLRDRPPDSRKVEDRLREHGPGEKAAEREPDHRDDRQERVAHPVLCHDVALLDPLGPPR